MRKFLVCLAILALTCGVAFANGSVTARGTNYLGNSLTNYDVRVIYGDSVGCFEYNIDTLNVLLGTNTILNSNIVDLSVKGKLLSVIGTKVTLGPGQQFDMNGAVVNRNYNGLELSLLGATVGAKSLATNLAGNVISDEISIALPVTLGPVTAQVAGYDLRNGVAGDTQKVEASTKLSINGLTVGLRGGVAGDTNKFGATTNLNLWGLGLNVAGDTVTGNYTKTGEPIRTVDVLDLPIINDSQAASFQLTGIKVGAISVEGTYVAYTNGSLHDVKAMVDNLTAQYRCDNVGNSLVRVGLSYQI